MPLGFFRTNVSPTRDFFYEVAAGNNSNLTVLHKFGRNGAVGTSWEDVWVNGGVYAWPTAAATLEAISADADDTAAGAGAQAIRVEGLDANFLDINEDIEMAGLSATSATTQSFLRVNRVYVVRAGTYSNTDNGPNQGAITVRVSSGGATQCLMGADGTVGMGQSAIARYSVPSKHTAFLLTYLANTDSSKNVQTALWQRLNADDTSTPFTGAKRMVFHLDGEAGAVAEDFIVPLVFTEKTDIWFSMKAAVGSAGSVDFILIVRAD